MSTQARDVVSGIFNYAFGFGNNRQTIFSDAENKQHFCKKLKSYSNEH